VGCKPCLRASASTSIVSSHGTPISDSSLRWSNLHGTVGLQLQHPFANLPSGGSMSVFHLLRVRKGQIFGEPCIQTVTMGLRSCRLSERWKTKVKLHGRLQISLHRMFLSASTRCHYGTCDGTGRFAKNNSRPVWNRLSVPPAYTRPLTDHVQPGGGWKKNLQIRFSPREIVAVVCSSLPSSGSIARFPLLSRRQSATGFEENRLAAGGCRPFDPRLLIDAPCGIATMPTEGFVCVGVPTSVNYRECRRTIRSYVIFSQLFQFFYNLFHTPSHRWTGTPHLCRDL